MVFKNVQQCMFLEDCSCDEDEAGSHFTCKVKGVHTLWFPVISVGIVKQKWRLS